MARCTRIHGLGQPDLGNLNDVIPGEVEGCQEGGGAEGSGPKPPQIGGAELQGFQGVQVFQRVLLKLKGNTSIPSCTLTLDR